MTVTGIAMVKDEADIIGTTVSHMLTQVDNLVIADNMSTDDTRSVLMAYAVQNRDRMMILEDPEVGYIQSQKMTSLAEYAYKQFGSDWIVPFDADEIWINREGGTIGEVLEDQHPARRVVHGAIFDYVATGDDDATEDNPVERIQWRRRKPGKFGKVAFRYAKGVVVEQGNHHVRFGAKRAPDGKTMFTIAHYPYRRPEQLLQKVRNGAAAYAATNLPEHFGNHWREWGRLLEEKGDDAIIDLFYEEFFWAQPTASRDCHGTFRPSLIHEPVKAIEQMT